jgi:hypothetical protein
MLQIVGTVQGIESRNGGWSAIAILQEGNQYPLKLSTKKPDLISQAMALMGQVVTAAYNEQQGTSLNPHTGQPYMNRYLEGITLGGQPMPQQYQQPQAQPVQQQQAPVQQQAYQQQPVSNDLKDLRITRLACLKVSVEIWKTFEPEARNIASLIAINEELTPYGLNGVPWTTAPTAAPAPVQQQQAPNDQPPPDDDIPF